jgi:hypothetical protein
MRMVWRGRSGGAVASSFVSGVLDRIAEDLGRIDNDARAKKPPEGREGGRAGGEVTILLVRSEGVGRHLDQHSELEQRHA